MKITVKRKCFASSDNIEDNQSKGYNLELGPGDVIVSNLTGARFKILKPKDGYVMVLNLDNGMISHISNDSLNSKIFHRDDRVNEINAADELDSEEYEIDHPEQEFDSAETSINSNKLPAVYRMISIPEGTVGVDFGGGKWNNAIEHIRDLGATLCVYDPYNRSAEHNREVIKTLKENGGADWAINSNVLNVIKEPEARRAVLENISKITKPGAPIYITVYEGRGDGNEGQTKSGYQLNRKTQDYLDDIREVFPDANRRGKLITAHNTGAASACITTSENMDKIEGVDFRPAIIGICDGIHDVIYAELTDIMTSPEFGFESDEVADYIRVATKLENDWIVVEIGAEVDFDGLSEICEKLTKVIAEYDPEAYFEPVDPGIAEAYLNTDTLLNNRKSHDVFSAVDSELSARNVVHVGKATFSVYYNKIDNSPEADPDIMFDTFKAKVGRLSPYDDANYAWANIHDGKIDIIRDGKIIDTSYYFNADDMGVENIEWCDAVIEQAVDALIEFDKDTQPRIITNSTVTSYVEPDLEEREGPKARPNEERVIIIDGYHAELAVADDGSYVVANDNLIDRADDIADVNDLVLSGGRYLKVWSDRKYHTELFDSVDVADAVSNMVADDVPENPGKYKLDCDVELTYAITDIATFDIDDPDRFDFDHIKSNLKRAEVFNVKISPIE